MTPNGSTVRNSISYNNDYGHTSCRHDDESGWKYFRARFFDVETGEFTSPEPLEFVDGMSLYRGYFALGASDPSGMSKISHWKFKSDKTITGYYYFCRPVIPIDAEQLALVEDNW